MDTLDAPVKITLTKDDSLKYMRVDPFNVELLDPDDEEPIFVGEEERGIVLELGYARFVISRFTSTFGIVGTLDVEPVKKDG